MNFLYIVAMCAVDGEMQMDEVYAASPLEAGIKFMFPDGDVPADIKSYRDLQKYAFENDCAIGVYRIDRKNHKNFTTNGPKHELPFHYSS